jgi:ATP-dependent protease ClpP protease subunit
VDNLKDSREFYITYNGNITSENINLLLNAIEKERKNEVNHFYLLISSEGGEIQPVLTAYSHLISMKDVYMTTCNIGKVASAANILFIAGKNRLACKHSYFLFHETRTISQKESLIRLSDARSFLLDGQNNERIMLDILSEKLKCGTKDIDWLFYGENILGNNADIFKNTPLSLGLVHEVVDFAPLGSHDNHLILQLK